MSQLRPEEIAGVPDRVFHDFRRTTVRNMVRAGEPTVVSLDAARAAGR